MAQTFKKITILTRSELTLLKLHMRRLLRQCALNTVTIVLVILALVMLNIALYEFLAAPYGKGLAALAVCGFNLLLALILFLIGTKMGPGHEAKMVEEVRDMTLAEIQADAQKASDAVDEITHEVQEIRSWFKQMITSIVSITHLVELIHHVFHREKGAETSSQEHKEHSQKTEKEELTDDMRDE